MTPEFMITTLVVVATPGAGVLYTVAAGISSVLAFSVVKWLGVIYLLYLAGKTFRDKSMLTADSAEQSPALSMIRRSFAASYLVLAGRLAAQSR